MSKPWQVSRRTVLRGMGASLALPMLDAMTPGRALVNVARAAAAAPKPPVRMAVIFLPNGMAMKDWRPGETGSDYALPTTLQPLAAFKDELLVFSGLSHDNGRAHGDGAGDHARAAASFLTGAHPHKTDGADIRNGVSVDQAAAQAVGRATPLPSLELSTHHANNVGGCDSGYSCAYSSNISWKSETQPVSSEPNPAAVFDRLFGSDEDRAAAVDRVRRLARRKSILDVVAGDARRLNAKLGGADRRKMDQFTTAVREIERRIERTRSDQADQPQPDMQKPPGIPDQYTEHLNLMFDMMALAFQTDQTRISAFMTANAGNNRSFPEVGVSDGHHYLSHHKGEAETLQKIAKIDRYYMAQFAYFLERLQSMPEGDGTVLDNSMIMVGSGLGDGNAHNHMDLPVMLAGRGGGTIDPGRHVKCTDNTPLCNLFLAMLSRMHVPGDSFGDSTGPLAELTV